MNSRQRCMTVHKLRQHKTSNVSHMFLERFWHTVIQVLNNAQWEGCKICQFQISTACTVALKTLKFKLLKKTKAVLLWLQGKFQPINRCNNKSHNIQGELCDRLSSLLKHLSSLCSKNNPFKYISHYYYWPNFLCMFLVFEAFKRTLLCENKFGYWPSGRGTVNLKEKLTLS